MDPEHETKAVAAVTARLQARFPDVDPTVVEAAVLVSHHEITGPVRDFVPLLVEHAARDRLAFTRGRSLHAGAMVGASAPIRSAKAS